MFDCFKKKPTPVKHQAPKKPRNYPKTYLDTALEITGSFEGSGYQQISGNFDKQGISAGILQWNYGQESLQRKILAPLIEKMGAEEIDSYFPKPVSVTAHMSTKQAIKYAKKYMLVGWSKKKLDKDWQRAWINFLKDERVIAQQKIAADSVASKAWYYCENHDMKSKRAFCWFFDVVTQNGSLKSVPKPDASKYNDDLSYDGGINKEHWRSLNTDTEGKVLFSWICDRVTRNRWASDVISRKGTIAHMAGKVHGDDYDLRSQIG